MIFVIQLERVLLTDNPYWCLTIKFQADKFLREVEIELGQALNLGLGLVSGAFSVRDAIWAYGFLFSNSFEVIGDYSKSHFGGVLGAETVLECIFG